MEQRARNATDVFDRMQALIKTIRSNATDAHAEAIRNPEYVRDCQDDIIKLTNELLGVMDEELDPFLRRKSSKGSTLEQRVEALEAQVFGTK